METVVAELLVEIIGAQSRRIDDPTGGEITAGRVHGGAVGADADSGDVGCGVELDPAGDRVGGQREVSGPGADDGLVGDGESAQRSVAEVGYLAVNLGGIDDFALRRSHCRPLCPAARAALRVLRRSTRQAARRCAQWGCRSGRHSRRAAGSRGQPSPDSKVPGLASNPVCRMAVLALLVPSPTSSRASIRAIRPRWPASARAMAEPTMPAPTIT